MTTRGLKAAILALGLTALAGTAMAGEVTGPSRKWVPWTDATMCKLRLDRVFQPNQGQPIHVTVTNVSKLRLQYKLRITVTEGGKRMPGGEILVDNANAGEQSERPSSIAYPGLIDGNIVTVSVISCSKRS